MSPASPATTAVRRDLAALGFALTSAAAFGLSGSFAKSLLDAGWTPGAATLLRIGGSAVVLAPLVLRAWWRRPPSPATLRMVLTYGVTAVALPQFAYFSAVQTLSVGVALLLEYLAPVLLVGLAWARTRRAPRRGTLVGALLSMIGLVLVLDLTGGVAIDPVGVAWGLTAAVGLSTYFVLSARVDDDLSPLVLAGGGLGVGTVTIGALGVVGALPMRATTSAVELLGAQVTWIVPALVLVLVSTVAAYLTGIVATARLGTRVASFVALTEVLFAVLAAWVLLGELPVPIQLLGGVAILAGVALVRRDATALVAPDPAPADRVPAMST